MTALDRKLATLIGPTDLASREEPKFSLGNYRRYLCYTYCRSAQDILSRLTALSVLSL